MPLLCSLAPPSPPPPASMQQKSVVSAAAARQPSDSPAHARGPATAPRRKILLFLLLLSFAPNGAQSRAPTNIIPLLLLTSAHFVAVVVVPGPFGRNRPTDRASSEGTNSPLVEEENEQHRPIPCLASARGELVTFWPSLLFLSFPPK